MKNTLNILRGRLCLLLCLGLFAACSSDDDEQTPSKKTYPLTIEVAENPLVNEGGEPVATKATITTTSSLSAFTMNYVYGTAEPGSVTAERTTEGKWRGGAWPNDAVAPNYEVNWYAYTGGTFKRTGNVDKKPCIDFTVEEAAENQHDLLVATALNKTWSDCKGHLSFTFDHACSAIRLYVKKATNLNGHTLSVSSIVLQNVVKQGNYFFETESWTLTGSSTQYTLYSGSGITLGSENYVLLNGSEDNSYLFMIPQTLTAWNPTQTLSNTYLELTCSIDGATSQTAYIPFAATFEKGTQHDVKINIGKNTLYSGPNTKVIP